MNPHLEAAIAADLAFEQCEQLRVRLRAARRLAFLEAQAAGVRNKDLAAGTGKSPQRVSKILDGNGPPKFRKGVRRSVIEL